MYVCVYMYICMYIHTEGCIYVYIYLYGTQSSCASVEFPKLHVLFVESSHTKILMFLVYVRYSAMFGETVICFTQTVLGK